MIDCRRREKERDWVPHREAKEAKLKRLRRTNPADRTKKTDDFREIVWNRLGRSTEMASLQDYQHTVARVHGYHNNKGGSAGWWECRIPSTALTRALTGRGASKYCPFMVEILFPTDKVLIAEKNSGLTPVGAQETIDRSPEGSLVSFFCHQL
jgi:hypothetical protein